MEGFSERNLKYMRLFAKEFSDLEFVQQAAALLPWFHLVTIINKVKNHEARVFYIIQSFECGWSRSVLTIQIETDLYKRQGKAIHNFKERLSTNQSDLANSTLKDPYIFDFLTTGTELQERGIEKGLVSHVEKF